MNDLEGKPTILGNPPYGSIFWMIHRLLVFQGIGDIRFFIQARGTHGFFPRRHREIRSMLWVRFHRFPDFSKNVRTDFWRFLATEDATFNDAKPDRWQNCFILLHIFQYGLPQLPPNYHPPFSSGFRLPVAAAVAHQPGFGITQNFRGAERRRVFGARGSLYRFVQMGVPKMVGFPPNHPF